MILITAIEKIKIKDVLNNGIKNKNNLPVLPIRKAVNPGREDRFIISAP